MIASLLADVLIESGDVLVLMVVAFGGWFAVWALNRRIQSLEEIVRSQDALDRQDFSSLAGRIQRLEAVRPPDRNDPESGLGNAQRG